MNEKNRGDIIPGVGCDVTNCKYNLSLIHI